MSSTNGARLLTRVQLQLKKRSKAGVSHADYSVLEHLLLGVCLEDADLPAAEPVLERLKNEFRDWNEVRVSSVRELELAVKGLPNREEKALRIKRILQSLFESTYGFDLEDLLKKPLGQATKRLNSLEGASSFAVAYTLQAGLGGHAIPVDEGVARLMVRLGIAHEDADYEEIRSRLERYIPKARGQEFTAVVRQVAVKVASKKKPEAVDKLLAEFGLTEEKPKQAASRRTKKTTLASTTKKKTTKKLAKKTSR